jgi:pimeloyl-ACP methyl ester carboxylesterase
MLTLIDHGPADATRPPLLIAHGLFGSGRNWGAIARRLSPGRRVLAVDMRNHGDSFRDPRHDYPAMADDLAEVIAAEGGQADVLGHSMGGKAAMALALRHGDAVRRLIVADIAPVAYGHSQQALIDAMRGLDLRGLKARSEADGGLAAAVADPGVRAFLLQSLDLKADPPRWRLNLDALEAAMPQILGWPDLTGRFARPTLFLAGAESAYVRPEYRPAIRALFPAAVHARIPDAGHWLHADKPREFAATVAAFLDAPDPAAPA